MIDDPAELARAVASRYALDGVTLTPLDTAVNDVALVRSAQADYALKLYHPGRTVAAVRWETDLVERLVTGGAPVARVVRGVDGPVELLTDGGRSRIAVLSEWATGRKPRPISADPRLDWGVCHLDLTLDNVHLTPDGVLTAFDLDSAGECWRAVEPAGVLRFSKEYFDAWLDGYRSVRRFPAADEAAVAAFGIVSEFRGVVWKLGAAESSRGTPLLGPAQLPAVVDGWLGWEANAVEDP